MFSACRLVYWYLLIFVPLDILTGFLLMYLGLEASLFVHPAQIIKGGLLIVLIISLLKDQFSKNYSYKRLFLFTCTYLIVASFLFGFLTGKFTGIFLEIYSVSKVLLVLLIAYQVQKHAAFFWSKADKIIETNFVFLTANLIFSYFTGIGIDTYDLVESSSKGFLYGGNAAAILTLVFFAYYTFHFKVSRKTKIYSVLALFSIYIVATKVIFFVPVVIGLYLFKRINTKWTPIRLAAISILIIPFFIFLVFVFIPQASNLIDSRYIYRINKYSNVHSFESALKSSRRLYYSYEQTNYLIHQPVKLFFGVGQAGQSDFWSGNFYNFAGMDFFDLLFQFGLMGAVLVYAIFLKALYKGWKNGFLRPTCLMLFLIFSYSFFGGYVLYVSTSGTMLGFLTGLHLQDQNG